MRRLFAMTALLLVGCRTMEPRQAPIDAADEIAALLVRHLAPSRPPPEGGDWVVMPGSDLGRAVGAALEARGWPISKDETGTHLAVRTAAFGGETLAQIHCRWFTLSQLVRIEGPSVHPATMPSLILHPVPNPDGH